MECLASKAKTARELLTLMKVIVPIVLVVIGVVLLVIAILRRHKPATIQQQPALPPTARRSRSRRAAGWTPARPRWGTQRGVYYHLYVWNSLPEAAAMVEGVAAWCAGAEQDVAAGRGAPSRVLGIGARWRNAAGGGPADPDGGLAGCALAHEVGWAWCARRWKSRGSCR